VWNKLGAIGAICSILAFIAWLLWPKGTADTSVRIESHEDTVVQAPVHSPGAVLQNMSDSPGGIQVAGDLNIQPNPLRQAIATATATVALTIQSDAEGNTYSAHQGGYAAFGRGNTVLLKALAIDSWRKQLGNGVVRYHSVFSMPADSPGVGEPIEVLKQAEYIQTEFKTMPTNSLVTGGTVVFVMNNSVRLEFIVPEQRCPDRRVFIRSLAEGMKPLASNKTGARYPLGRAPAVP